MYAYVHIYICMHVDTCAKLLHINENKGIRNLASMIVKARSLRGGKVLGVYLNCLVMSFTKYIHFFFFN